MLLFQSVSNAIQSTWLWFTWLYKWIHGYRQWCTYMLTNCLCIGDAAWLINRSARGWSIKHLIQSKGQDTALYKNVPFLPLHAVSRCICCKMLGMHCVYWNSLVWGNQNYMWVVSLQQMLEKADHKKCLSQQHSWSSVVFLFMILCTATTTVWFGSHVSSLSQHCMQWNVNNYNRKFQDTALSKKFWLTNTLNTCSSPQRCTLSSWGILGN